MSDPHIVLDAFRDINVLPPDAMISAGSVNSLCTAGGGQLNMWGKIKNTGDDWMYPKPLMDLSGWNLRCMDSGNMHHFVGADSSCISWGHAEHGELGYGPNAQKSSAAPKKVDIFEGMHVMGVACGMGHSMVIVDGTNVGERLYQLDIYDGKASGEGKEEPIKKAPAPKQSTKKGAKGGDNSKKKKPKESSESGEEDDDGASDDKEQENGVARGKRKRGGNNSGRAKAKAKGFGAGRNRSPVKTGKRRRPHNLS